jgi:hypothetical protein
MFKDKWNIKNWSIDLEKYVDLKYQKRKNDVAILLWNDVVIAHFHNNGVIKYKLITN